MQKASGIGRLRESPGNMAFAAGKRLVDNCKGDETFDYAAGSPDLWTRPHRGNESHGSEFDRMLKGLLPASLNALRAAAASANIGDVRGHLGWALSRGRLTINGKLAEHRVTPR